jgi:hypothetical protein
MARQVNRLNAFSSSCMMRLDGARETGAGFLSTHATSDNQIIDEEVLAPEKYRPIDGRIQGDAGSDPAGSGPPGAGRTAVNGGRRDDRRRGRGRGRGSGSGWMACVS